MACEFSAAFFLSCNVKVSTTLIDPRMENVLFLRDAATAKWAASAHSQQLLWQIWVKAVSGMALRLAACDASALYSNPDDTACWRGGISLKLHGQAGSSGSSGNPPNSILMFLWHPHE